MLAERCSAPANPKLSPPGGKSPWDAVHVDGLPNLYAMQAFGECMDPEIAHGQLLVFDKLSPCRPGDMVIIIKTAESLRPGEFPALVKRLVEPLSATCSVLTVESLNPRRRYSFMRRDVAAVHLCLGPGVRQPDGSTGVSQKVIDAARAGQ